MIDGKQIRQQLIGSDEERAVSPVIGVILMVAITVILAAVIATFVMDLGGSIGQEVQAGVTIEETSEEKYSVTWQSQGSADWIEVTASDCSIDDEPNPDGEHSDTNSLENVGETLTVNCTDLEDTEQITATGHGEAGSTVVSTENVEGSA